MYTTTLKPIVSDPNSALRFCARASAATLFLTWLAFVAFEAFSSRLEMPTYVALPQAVALAVVFAGYASGVWNELLGSALTFLGMAAFYVVHVVTLSVPPEPAMATFALPGLFYILAWNGHRAEIKSRARDL